MRQFGDNFNRANENPIAAPWTNFVGALSIVSNVVRPTTVDNEDVAGGVFTSAGNDWFASIKLTTLSGTGENFVVLYGMDGSGNGYSFLARMNPGANPTSQISRQDGFAGTALVTESATTWASGDILMGVRLGSKLFLYRNGVLLLSTTEATYSVAAGASLSLRHNTPNTPANLEVDDYFVADPAIREFTLMRQVRAMTDYRRLN